jgi:hypothetical protein
MDPSNLAGLVKSASVAEAPVTATSQAEYIETALREGQALWDAVKAEAKDPEFARLPDNKKIDKFSLRFHPFNKEFPIVSRYLICMGQYSGKAFKRYLLKVQGAKHPEVRDKGYMEDQWVRRQADYIRYLWESYQRKHYNNSEAKTIWKEAYETLKKEFLDFRNMHENIEQKLEADKKVNKQELVVELMDRLASGEQSLEDAKMKELLEVLSIQLFQQRKEKLMSQLKAKTPEVPAARQGVGTAPDPEAEAAARFQALNDIGRGNPAAAV